MSGLGIDISPYQRDRIDTVALRGASRFIAIKQTEGLSYPDVDDPAAAQLLAWWRGWANDVDFDVILLYHYLRPQPGRTGGQEADHFADVVGHLSGREALAVDDEWEGASLGDDHEEFVIEFLDEIEARYPDRTGKVLYYSYPAYLDRVPTGRVVLRSPLWIAAYGPNDGQAHEEAVRLDRWSPDRCVLWQFTSRGSGFPGVQDTDPPSLDVNVCYDLDRLKQLVLP